MQVLIAEDNEVSRRLLEILIGGWGYDIISAADGKEAWKLLQENNCQLAILDWMMPGMDGLEVCRRLRALEDKDYVYVIVLTAREERQDIVTGLEAGADDYMVKPFDNSELRSRIKAGERIVELKAELGRKITELKDALAHVKQLQGIMPICVHCHKIRDDERVWHRLEEYIQTHSEAVFSHALCEECMKKHYPDIARQMENEEDSTD